MKAIIALDSFKGCLTAEQAGAAALKAFPEGEAVAREAASMDEILWNIDLQ